MRLGFSADDSPIADWLWLVGSQINEERDALGAQSSSAAHYSANLPWYEYLFLSHNPTQM